MWIQVKTYALLWSVHRRRGIVKFELSDETEHKIIVKSPRQYLVIVEILRGGKAAFYNPLSGSISSPWETLRRKSRPGEKSSQKYKAAFDKASEDATDDIEDSTSEDFDPAPIDEND